MAEYDKNGKRRSDDDETPDVDAHRWRHRRGDDEARTTEVEPAGKSDGGEDDTPDVEAHRFRHR